MNLESVSWTDVRDSEVTVGLIPVGSTEQHGPHAPLGTDFLTAGAIAEKGAEIYPERIVVTPSIPVGIAEEHRHFDGTLWVSPDTFRAYVRETIESLASHGIDRVVIVNGHGGNRAALREVCHRLIRTNTAYAVPFTWFDSITDHDESMGHAGPIETSVVWHLSESLIATDRLEAARDGGSDRWGEWLHHVNLAIDSSEFTESGVVGDPTNADPETGRKLVDIATKALVDLIEAVESRDIPD